MSRIADKTATNKLELIMLLYFKEFDGNSNLIELHADEDGCKTWLADIDITQSRAIFYESPPLTKEVLNFIYSIICKLEKGLERDKLLKIKEEI